MNAHKASTAIDNFISSIMHNKVSFWKFVEKNIF